MKKTMRYTLIGALLFLGWQTTSAQFLPNDSPQVKAITAAMNKSAEEWNKGDLTSFVAIYDPSATMMMPGGTVGLDSIKGLYRYKYFKGGMPKQNLRYSDMKVRLLGSKYALLTGAFTLYGNGLPERSGRYSLVMVFEHGEWKILHDHSG